MSDDLSPRDLFFSSADGLTLHAKEWGQFEVGAIPVVCLPGLARTADDFDVIAHSMATGEMGPARRVIALDYRGRGLSDRDRNWRNYDMRVENNDILNVLTAMGVGEAIYLGTSRGGMHIMVLAATRPASIKAAILNDIGPVLEAKGLARIRGYVGKLPAPKSWDDALDLSKHIMSAQFTGLSDEDWQAYTRATFEEKDGRFLPRYDTNLLRVLAELDLNEALPTLWPQFNGLRHVPLMVIRGEHSDLLSPRTLDKMMETHPGCQSLEVPGQGHAPLLRDQLSIRAIAEFVAPVQ